MVSQRGRRNLDLCLEICSYLLVTLVNVSSLVTSQSAHERVLPRSCAGVVEGESFRSPETFGQYTYKATALDDLHCDPACSPESRCM